MSVDSGLDRAWAAGEARQSRLVFIGRGLDVHGRVPGYARLDLDTRYTANRRLQVHARIDNALDRRYANFGILGENVFTGPGRSFGAAHPRAEQFLGRGAPRGVSIGLRYTFE